MKPRLAVLQLHPPPYRNATFKKVHERNLVDIQVFSMFPTDRGHDYRRQVELGYPNIFLKKYLRVTRNVSFHADILPLLQGGNYDILLVPGWKNLTEQTAIAYALTTGRPFIYSSDTILSALPYNVYLARLLEAGFRLLVRQAASYWVPGKASQEFLEHYGAHHDRIFQGSYCLDLDYLMQLAEAARPRRREIRQQLGVDDSDWLFLFVGRMLPQRGLPVLLRAYAQLSRRQPAAKLLLVGDGHELPWLKEQRTRLGLSGLILLAPMPMQKLTDYYLAADAYVMPALFERYSLALAQAAICGLPMISTERVGAVKDYIQEGYSGYIVPPGNDQALMEAMERTATNRDEARALGRNASLASRWRPISWAAEQLESAVFKALERRPR